MLPHNVDIFKGVGSFVDQRTIRVNARGKEPDFLKGDIILIATTGSPVVINCYNGTEYEFVRSHQMFGYLTLSRFLEQQKCQQREDVMCH